MRCRRGCYDGGCWQKEYRQGIGVRSVGTEARFTRLSGEEDPTRPCRPKRPLRGPKTACLETKLDCQRVVGLM